jgi:molybdopterin-binding protein
MLQLKGISRRFADFSLEEVSFTVNRGDYFILLGESGAGKSMILETIAGLVKPDSGTITMNGQDITHEKIQHRGIGLVFQDHAVFPHMKVRENIAYSLHGQNMTAAAKREKVVAVTRQLSIEYLLDRHPSTLSGGELQRVALARTLIHEPKILLLDEPLASLDSRLKTELRALLRSIHRNGHTLVHVTHDYEEALSLGTRIAVIDKGTIVQEGTPQDVFQHPRSEFVAHFAGLRNFFPVVLEHHEDLIIAHTGGIKIHLVTVETNPEGFIIIRGEDIVLSESPIDTSMTNNFEGRVTEVVLSRFGYEVTVDTGILLHALVTESSVVRMGLTEGKKVWLHFKATAVKYFTR